MLSTAGSAGGVEGVMGVHYKFQDEKICSFLRGYTIFVFANGEFGLAWETMSDIGNRWLGRFKSFDAVISEIERIDKKPVANSERRQMLKRLRIK